jgi:hypothetical protein
MWDGDQAYAETGPAGQSPDPEFFNQNSGKQRKNSERFAVFPFAERLGIQDFRGERDVAG